MGRECRRFLAPRIHSLLHPKVANGKNQVAVGDISHTTSFDVQYTCGTALGAVARFQEQCGAYLVFLISFFQKIFYLNCVHQPRGTE